MMRAHIFLVLSAGTLAMGVLSVWMGWATVEDRVPTDVAYLQGVAVALFTHWLIAFFEDGGRNDG